MAFDWKEVGNYVKQFAPLLGTAIAGPAGTAVGGAVSLLCSAFGISGSDVNPENVLSTIQMSPEAKIKLAEVEANNKIELSKLALQQDQMFLQDRQSARIADVEKTKATGSRDINLYVLSWVVVAGFYSLVGLLIFVPIQETSGVVKDALLILFGALIAGYKDVLGYFFGSSKGSSDKTKLLTGSKEQ